MGSICEEVFPVIDFSDFESRREEKTKEIFEACTKWGFMILTNYGIPQEKIDRMFQLHREFCSQPDTVKGEHTINQRQIGFDLKRSKIGVNEGMVFGGVKGDIVAGDNVPSWWDDDKRADVEDFKDSCHKLGKQLLECFAIGLGLSEGHFTTAHRATEEPGDVLRMLHYPALKERPSTEFPRLYAHTDWGSLTFVWALSSGLEVETPSKQWVPAPLIPGGVIVNVADAMSIWSGKTLKSTLHKISFDNLPIDKDRWSMAYFVNANRDTTLEILKPTADGQLTNHASGLDATMGDYHNTRLYMSQREDHTKNWISGNVGLKPNPELIKIVESLGIANGSGTINMEQVTI